MKIRTVVYRSGVPLTDPRDRWERLDVFALADENPKPWHLSLNLTEPLRPWGQCRVELWWEPRAASPYPAPWAPFQVEIIRDATYVTARVPAMLYAGRSDVPSVTLLPSLHADDPEPYVLAMWYQAPDDPPAPPA